MSEQKQRAPFKSGVLDHEELYKRIKELNIQSPFEKTGVDITPQPTMPEQAPRDYQSAYFRIAGDVTHLWKIGPIDIERFDGKIFTVGVSLDD